MPHTNYMYAQNSTPPTSSFFLKILNIPTLHPLPLHQNHQNTYNNFPPPQINSYLKSPPIFLARSARICTRQNRRHAGQAYAATPP